MIHRLSALILSFVIIFSLGACTRPDTQTKAKDTITAEVTNDSSVDLDLTRYNPTMIYTQIVSMYKSPDEYMGKKIKVYGMFSAYLDEATGKYYYSVFSNDYTQCCRASLEFVLEGNNQDRKCYPEANKEITVKGIFDTYTENGQLYCRLNDAEIC